MLGRRYAPDTLPDAPRDPWPEEPTQLHAEWWQARIARQKEIDASIAAKAEFEYLYDKPYRGQVARPRRRPVHRREPVAASLVPGVTTTTTYRLTNSPNPPPALAGFRADVLETCGPPACSRRTKRTASRSRR